VSAFRPVPSKQRFITTSSAAVQVNHRAPCGLSDAAIDEGGRTIDGSETEQTMLADLS